MSDPAEDRKKFIRAAAIELYARLGVQPHLYRLDDEGATTEAWKRADALWKAKPQDC